MSQDPSAAGAMSGGRSVAVGPDPGAGRPGAMQPSTGQPSADRQSIDRRGAGRGHAGHRSGGRYDCIVVGGGHNGLVCANYLARGGRSVLVLEAAEQVGGAAITREFWPGFKVSAGAHLLHLMPEALIHELNLGAHGLHLVGERLPTTALAIDQAPLLIDATNPTNPAGLADLASRSAADAVALPRYFALLHRLGATLQPLFEMTPPRLGTDSWRDRLALLRMGLRLRRLGRKDMRELLRIGGMCVHDLLEEHFETPLLKGALGFDAVLGTNLAPRSPGSVFALLYRMAAASAAGGSLSLPGGGMGALSDALAKAAIDAGVVIRTGAPVERILVREDRAAGVRLESGEEWLAPVIVSNADPKTTFLRLLGPEYLDAGFVRRVGHLRVRGLTAKLHLALDRLPQFAGVEPAALRGRMLVSPSSDYIERAFNHAKYGEFSRAPILELTLPSVSDGSLAPPGKHVLSAIVQYVPYELAAGNWDAQRGRLTDIVVELLEAHAPELRQSVLAAELLTPADIERNFRICGGHWHHAQLALDQFLMVRPVPGAAQYRTPLEGLFLCGAGTHPGGGVMGIAGRNAAREVLRTAMSPRAGRTAVTQGEAA